ncbi:MAG: C1 family peptidase [bacterium]
MSRRFARAAAAALLLAVLLARAEDFSQYRLGLVFEDLSRAPGWVQVQQVDVLPGRPSCDTLVQVDLSPEMPPVGNQRSQGSCTAWAVGYYHKTHTEWLEHGWDVNDPLNQFSPAFIYNQINGGVDQGSSFSDAMQLMIDQGGGNLVDNPYRYWDCTTWPSEAGFARALPYRAEGRYTISLADTTGVNAVRQRLANGLTSTIGIAVYSNFDNIRNFNNTYCAADRYGSNRGGHAVTLVGYCDTLTTNDGPGAFRVANSWGTGWGDEGYFWMSYVAVMDTGLSARSVAYATDRTGYEPSLLARVRVAHGSREKVGMRFVVGPRAMPLFRRELRPWRRARADVPFPDHDLIFDLTEAESLLVASGADSLFFNCYDGLRDGISGTIEHFSIEDAEGNYIARCWDVPMEIPEGSWVGAYALIPLPLGVADATKAGLPTQARGPTVVRATLNLDPGQAPASLLDAAGRRLMHLRPGANQLGHLVPGVYFVRPDDGTRARKVLLQR